MQDNFLANMLSGRTFGAKCYIKPYQEVSWQRGNHITWILNVDGSALTNLSLAGFCGLIRRHDGSFIFRFHMSVGLFNILHAEIQALCVGIKLYSEA
ncbi:hypothetical protein MTR_8g070610 [Medicago truncatula]|uniref:RNase H type-1 domain-containing protein n=1 Tax=Medicago truncatula TaxID=3880 RepID=G7L721_MEDTR|nr:hypothetical protein MTR_8g070610 [Medicago truncatula]